MMAVCLLRIDECLDVNKNGCIVLGGLVIVGNLR